MSESNPSQTTRRKARENPPAATPSKVESATRPSEEKFVPKTETDIFYAKMGYRLVGPNKVPERWKNDLYYKDCRRRQ